jgi:hypothetical protein
MLMANAMYATVARDGLSIGLMARDNPIQPVLGNPAASRKTSHGLAPPLATRTMPSA